jgi:hypothetical protein
MTFDTSLTPGQNDALIAAGGCVHTPNPFKGCDTCARPPIGGNFGATTAYGFVAELMNGDTIVRADAPSVDHLPLDVVRRLIVVTDDPRIPRVVLQVDPDKGERLFRFSRHIKRVASGDGPNGAAKASLKVEVIEVRYDDGKAVRLYLHPFQGPILSTQDLYF